MDVRISLLSDDPVAGLESLSDWLQGEHELAGRVRLAATKPREGEMGGLADALVVAVGSGGTLSVLAMSLNTWMSQPRRSNVRIRVASETGRTVEISAERVDGHQVETLVRQVLGAAAPEE